ncbi:MAG: N-acetylmuramidase family protein [Aquamicrobium sp.]|uniref:N-acetylmuramidase family protein n=1 Tax=Aquamicrobium sp. TaxID=1872579 RepID=UPI00349EF806|nr:N-acetylmuramidase family protein [Aquamicrobium sp.]
MNFAGKALPLSDGDVRTIAGYLGCHVAAVRAVIQVESAGRAFGNDKRPIILNEPHVFYRELGPDAKRDRAVREGLAYAKWGAKPYPRSQPERYAWLKKAMTIDEAAALKSCSWGLGQVMGFNHKVCGFDTVQAFVEAMKYSEGAHLYAIARFIVSKGLQRHLKAKNWSSFAKGYNGSGYAKHGYHTKLAAAYARRPDSEKITPLPASEAQLNALIGKPAPHSAPPAPAKPVPAPKPTQPAPTAPEPAMGFWARLFAALFGRK